MDNNQYPPYNGFHNTYHDGKIWRRTEYKNGVKHGVEEEFWVGDDKKYGINIRRTHKNGFLHGLFEWTYDNGQIGRQQIFVNSVAHGEYKDWNRYGELNEHCLVVDGIFNELSKQDQITLCRYRSKEKHLVLRLKHGVPLIKGLKYGYETL